MAANRGVEETCEGIVDYSDGRTKVDAKCERNADIRKSMNEIRGTINWVNDKCGSRS